MIHVCWIEQDCAWLGQKLDGREWMTYQVYFQSCDLHSRKIQMILTLHCLELMMTVLMIQELVLMMTSFVSEHSHTHLCHLEED